ncbi:MAG TPA: ABC transporter permease [Geminicoccaceae bacterium]|nr:ABC transporter permease [Geminicoccus sp.]HMU49734.1 ABC transporter permease [Geminicoccaceae bacterium]
METWRNQPWVFWTFLLPGLLWLAVFFLIPLGFIWTIAFGERSGPADIVVTWTWANYIQALDPLYLGLFLKSFWIAAVATALCLVLSFPVALAVSFAPARVKPLLLMLVILPFWTNLLIRTYALIAVLRGQGYVNWTLEWLWGGAKALLTPIGLGGLFGDSFQPLELLYNNTAVIFGIVYVYLPFMVLPLYATLERLDRSYLEASLDLGAGQWRTLFSVTVPLAMPGIVSGVILVFIPALGTFLISDLLGGPDSQLIGNVIERQFKSANNLPLGAAMSFILLYLTFVFLALRAWLGGRETAHG